MQASGTPPTHRSIAETPESARQPESPRYSGEEMEAVRDEVRRLEELVRELRDELAAKSRSAESTSESSLRLVDGFD